MSISKSSARSPTEAAGVRTGVDLTRTNVRSGRQDKPRAQARLHHVATGISITPLMIIPGSCIPRSWATNAKALQRGFGCGLERSFVLLGLKFVK